MNEVGQMSKLLAFFICLFFLFACRQVAIAAGVSEESKEKAAEQNSGTPANAVKQAEEKDEKEADARELFSKVKEPLTGPAASIGEANCGCLAGAVRLKEDSAFYQVMKPSRNRYWGHPSMIAYIENLGLRAQKGGWNGLLIGDLSMPRGGPMPSDHASHQRGTDVDIWLKEAPAHRLSYEEREKMDAYSVLKKDSAELDSNVWTQKHANFVKCAAQDDHVTRIFVSPAIKKYLCSCKKEDGSDTVWLRRLRPWEGHDDHIHVRLKCPPGDPCVEQEAQPEGDGCGQELSEWLQKTALDPPNKSIAVEESSEIKPFPLSKLPSKCIELLNAKN